MSIPAFPTHNTADTLPIHDCIPDILKALRECGRVVLEAPPGAGKTTIVPLALADAFPEGKIVVLEPRRLAAKSAAVRMSTLIKDDVGGIVGYRMRMESRTSSRTRIEVVTEGVLTRMLQHDPELTGISCIVFDEVHERSLSGDVGLALVCLLREMFRPDLRVVVMSATLGDVHAILNTVGQDTAVIRSSGRMFPVTTSYLARQRSARLDEDMSRAIVNIAKDATGSILCFLPGSAEIRRTAALLAHVPDLEVLPLYGDLSFDEQQRVFAAPDRTQRRVILATNIAETSITLPDVRHVIDGGLSREARYDLAIGMTRLVTAPVTLDAAEQRRGRAGRTAPGTCLRLWTEAEQASLLPRRQPEILVADVTALVLDLAVLAFSVHDVPFLDPPPDSSVQAATTLLMQLEALHPDGTITEHGRRIAHLGTHPRLGHMLMRVQEDSGLSPHAAAAVAALLGERDIFVRSSDIDLLSRIAVVLGNNDDRADRTAVQLARQRMSFWLSRLKGAKGASTDALHDAASCVALAYPDRLAIHRGNNRYLLRNGRTVTVNTNESTSLDGAHFLVIPEIRQTTAGLVAASALPITTAEIRRLFEHQISAEVHFGYDEAEDRVVRRTEQKLGALVLSTTEDQSIDEHDVSRALADVIIHRQYRDLNIEEARPLLQRLIFLAWLTQSSKDVAPLSLIDILTTYLTPDVLTSACRGYRKLRDVVRIDVSNLILSTFDYQQRQDIERLAPQQLTLGARTFRITYDDPQRPVLAAKLQHLYDVTETPYIGAGKVPLTIHLLSPAGRPVQITQDLKTFWQTSYADVKKELKGRYPKHEWR